MKSWQQRRTDMQQVCTSCHAPGWVENWYRQFDNEVTLYNDKFGRPAAQLYQIVRKAGLITNDVDFDDKLEFTYYLLWHHEGRRARHGAAMMGPGLHAVARELRSGAAILHGVRPATARGNPEGPGIQ